MTELQALLMGLLQGLTEYLPVSSSGHLTIASALLGIGGEENLTFTIAVHVATVLSTLVILWREIVWLLRGLVDTKAPLMSPERRYILAIIVSMIPIGIVGVFFKDYVEAIFGSGLLIVGLSLIMTSALLTLSYYAHPRQKEDIGLMLAFIIGLAQSVAVLPGLSRSGTTIATGLMLGVKKEKMAQFSFLMVIPPILGEALLSILKAAKDGAEAATGDISMTALAIGFLAAFISGCMACKWMISIVKKGKLVYFGIYCAIVGCIILGSNLL
ncbi:MAG: undecaprenyl-diphosphate phosphatase [Bacteroidaceae bacterium]|nr:undecaprenyl-diphosphate phosphatase [Bacteroidaceae bacterium]